MGGLCCYQVGHQEIEADDLVSTRRVCKTDVPSGQLVSISYAQQKVQKFRGYCEIEAKRLLAFSQDHIFIDSFMEPNGAFKDVYAIGPKAGSIIHGSFVHNYKPKHFLTLTETSGRYFVRTYSISQDEDHEPTLDKSKKRLMKRLKQLDPNLFHQWLNRAKEKEKSSHSADSASVGTCNENSYAINQGEEKEVEDVQSQTLTCVKTIKNIVCGQSELILTSESMIVTVTINKSSILVIRSQESERKVIGVEYWSGYYFLLYEDNVFGIYKRGISGQLEEVKLMELALKGVKPDLNIRLLKVPKLEWSGRLPDILHKDLPTHLLLVGTYIEKGVLRNCVVKHNIYTNQCTAHAVLDPKSEITAINYGPYDNGPIMIGLNNGMVLIYDYYSLDSIRKVKGLVEGKVKWIAYEPGNAMIIGSEGAVYKCGLMDI